MNRRDNQNTRDAAGRFVPGNPGGPAGRKCGRSRALAMLDEMLSAGGNLDILHKALEEHFRKNPVRFFRQIIMPLLPVSARMEIQHSGPVVWKGLVETMDERDTTKQLQQEK